MAGRVAGKVALVTGAARGLGAEYATLLAEEGATSVVADIRDELGSELVSDLRSRGLAADYRHLDVRSEPEWERLVAEIVATHGRLDVLVNNAGIARMETVLDETLAGWDDVVAVNQTGPFLGMKHCAPVMQRQGGGSIINIASVWGLVGGPNLVAYHAAKASLFGLTRNAAVQLAPTGVRVNTVCPGAVLTEMALEEEAIVPGTIANVVGITPMARAAAPRELAYAVLFLASDEASYVTGADLVVDGGIRAGYMFRPPGGE
jgi:NAD(P)-dependent dehydrogenase (short-subunit alcohol dehydrogenase family)